MSYFSNKFTELCESRTISEIAAVSGISQPLLSQYRNGNRNVTVDSLSRLLVAFSHLEQCQLVHAHLLDECPESLMPDLRIAFDACDQQTNEDPPPRHNKQLEAAIEYLAIKARNNPDVARVFLDLASVI